MCEEIIAEIYPDMRRRFTGRVEEHEIAEFQIGGLDDSPGLVLFRAAARKQLPDGIFIDQHGVRGTVDPIIILPPKLVRDPHHLGDLPHHLRLVQVRYGRILFRLEAALA